MIEESENKIKIGSFSPDRDCECSKEVKKNVISELLDTLAAVSNSENPLKMSLPIPFIVNNDEARNKNFI